MLGRGTDASRIRVMQITIRLASAAGPRQRRQGQAAADGFFCLRARLSDSLSLGLNLASSLEAKFLNL